MTREALILGEGEPIPENAVVAYVPQPGPQMAMLECPADEVVVGGQRGGGKTYGTLGAFASYAASYGEEAVGALFRRTYPELEDAIAKSRRIFGPMGWRYNESLHDWRAPAGSVGAGAWFRFRYLDKDTDAESYQGHEIPFQIFEEIGNFPTSTPIDLLFGCLRSAAGIPKFRYMTCNPGGPGHQWVKARYIAGREPNRVFRYQPQPELAPDLWVTACFIPAALEDNPALLSNDPGYEVALAAATMGNEALYRAWRFGDWDVIAGAYFDCWDPTKQTYPDGEVEFEPWYPRWIAADWGFVHNTVIHWIVSDGAEKSWTDRELCLKGFTAKQLAKAIADVEAEIQSAAAARGRKLAALDAFYLSPDAFGRKEQEKSIAQQMADTLAALPMLQLSRLVPDPTPAADDRVSGWMLAYSLLKHGQHRINRDRCPELVRTIPILQHDPKHPEDVQKIKGDDPGDSWRYGLKTRDLPAIVPREVRVAERIKAEVRPDADLTSKAIHARRISDEERDTFAPIFRSQRMARLRRAG